MAEVKKYFVARGPFHVPAPIIEEGDTVELDSDVAAQFVREGTLNPVDFVCDDGGHPVVDDGAADTSADTSSDASTDTTAETAASSSDASTADTASTDTSTDTSSDTSSDASTGASGETGE